MRELTAGDFRAYFQAVHGCVPFPWQERLLATVADGGCWPSLLDLPTGAGKTAAIDVAVFHLALEAPKAPAERKAPRRIVMVVDRRTVVDQAFERARTIARAIERAGEAKEGTGVLHEVAERLRSYTGGGAPLALAQLRGGMPRDDAWAARPDQPVVAVSTVDQVGSRLLFRGYGVSDGMRPIHAGLLGNDVLLLLDEVHLSVPFQQTLGAVKRYRAWPGRDGTARTALPDRWQFVQMSATPGSAGDFGLDEKDRENELLARRLAAKKPVDSRQEPVKRGAFAEVCAAQAASLAKRGRVVGVVVNRVATARDVAARLRGDSSLRGDKRVFLVTGRMRPVDRNDLDAELAELVRAGRKRGADAAPVFVVSTQCIEAGADFDFDALVTECASLDALRQRFGRLNRLGEIDDARGVVLVQAESVGKEGSDPIYGSALAETWRWLREAERDLGIDAIEPAMEELKKIVAGGGSDVGEGGKGDEDEGEEGGDARTGLDRLLSPKERAPVMLPGHLDTWVQTKPAPVPDPDVSLWLHGVRRRQTPEVQIVWRGDLTERLLDLAAGDEGIAEALRERVAACPPLGLEALSVPIDAARAWLTSSDAPELADVEGQASEEREEGRRSRQPRSGRPTLLWTGDDGRVIRAEELRPEQTIVVPCEYGGLAPSGGASGGSWDPTCKDRVDDLAERARWEQTRRPVLRLHPAIVGVAAWAKAPSPADAEDPDQEDRDAVDAVLEQMRASAATGAGTDMGAAEKDAWRTRALDGLQVSGKKRPAIVRLDDIVATDEHGRRHVIEPGYLAVVGRFRVSGAGSGEGGGDATTEEDAGSLTGVEVTLREHLAGVAAWARRFAEACGLPDKIARSVEAAAAWHDAGKVDPRFQRLLRGGSDSRSGVDEPIAKSRIVQADRTAQRRAAERSGYPRGTRHELASVALLVTNTDLLGSGSGSGSEAVAEGSVRAAVDADAHGAVDVELVLHLIASHHGHCRPFAPVPAGDEAEPVELEFAAEGRKVTARSDHGLERLDAGLADRFWAMVERYGWFGLAWLEAILRLADHRRSEEEQQEKTHANRRGEHGESGEQGGRRERSEVRA